MNVKNVLKQTGFTFKKAFGQNFLTDESLLAGVVERSGVNENTVVLEIGVGAGTLTREIAKRAKRVVGYEIDKSLQPVLNETLKDFSNVEIVYEDVMKSTMQEIENKLNENYILVANLPYYITTPIVMRFIEEAKNVLAIVITIQKEVALRLVAKPKTSDYGSITVSVDAESDGEIIEYIGREKFYPVPNVDSAVVKLTLNRNKYQNLNPEKFKKLVKCAFTMRRKTLVNNLIKGYGLTREQAENTILSLGYDAGVRGEELSTQDFIKISNAL
ncbi:MAG: ribosomal RNA small subunit methyltransferase A [Clostridia bacterium]|nr:ribosomal RNA small subunit methyltransferase A [Clostridia bacterium]